MFGSRKKKNIVGQSANNSSNSMTHHQRHQNKRNSSATAKAIPVRSSKRGIYLSPACQVYKQQPPGKRILYPYDPPSSSAKTALSHVLNTWRSCEDAYEYTWLEDPDQHIIGLDELSRQKLARSMGYCPHRRCQLDNDVGNSFAPDHSCPPGLCYTKIEAGGLPSFGACCFDQDGLFDSGDLIGVESKSQYAAKPIYKKNRIILGEPVTMRGKERWRELQRELKERDTSKEKKRNVEKETVIESNGGTDSSTPTVEESERDRLVRTFVNANMIADNLISTQCPMISTIDDIKTMIIQEDVTLWIQLSHPSQITIDMVRESDSEGQESEGKSKIKKSEDCHVLPYAIQSLSSNGYLDITASTVSSTTSDSQSIVEERVFQLTYSIQSINNEMRIVFHNNNDTNSDSDIIYHTHTVKYYWFKGWEDFMIPEDSDNEVSQCVIVVI